MDFCSKLSAGTNADDFSMFRDVRKLFTTRMYYSKNNG